MWIQSTVKGVAMYQILRKTLAEMTREQRMDLLKNLYESCGYCRFSFIN